MVSNKEKNFISAVVYVNNDEKYIINFLENIYKVLEENFNKFEIILVNDCSDDDTVEKVKKFAKGVSTSVISIVNMSFYQGVELSMNAGVNLAIGDFVYEFDNVYKDYDNEVIINTYFRSLKGFDIVSATPKNYKKRSSQIFYKIFNNTSNTNYKLDTETFRLLSRRAINRVHSMSKTIPYRKALYSNCGLKLYNIIYENKENVGVKLHKKQDKNRQGIAIDSLILFTDLAYKLSIWMTLIMMSIVIITAIYVIAVFFGTKAPVEGWTTTMLFLSGSFFGVFAIMAIIIKYLSLIVNLIFRKQEYIIESIEKVS